MLGFFIIIHKLLWKKKGHWILIVEKADISQKTLVKYISVML